MRRTLFPLVLVFSLLVSLLITGCTTSGGKEFSDDFSRSPIYYTVERGTGYLRWAPQEGATEYTVRRSMTRYGRFETVAQTSECTYVSEDPFAYYEVTAQKDGKTLPVGLACAFGEHTLVVGPNDDMTAVQAHIDAVHARLEHGYDGQFSSERFALLLLPGDYPLTVKVGYYTSVCGLGASPEDVTVDRIYVSNEVLSDENATCTFWRSIENITVREDAVWAVSQATSLRRMNFLGDLKLSYSGWSSGGFLANSRVAGSVDPGSQQQWLSLNDEWTRWTRGDSHNFVFSGCKGGMPQDGWTENTTRVTILTETERMAEKPYLIYEKSRGYGVVVPAVKEYTSGVDWENTGKFLPLSEFRIAAEEDTASALNEALLSGEHLLFPAGQYALEAPLAVTLSDTVVLGMGYPTLKTTEENLDCAVRLADVGGIRLAAVLVDANTTRTLVEVGRAGSHVNHSKNPTLLSDLFLRIGGAENRHTEVDTALAIYSDDVLGDNFWVWRADHSEGVQWEDLTYTDEKGPHTLFGNPVRTGVLVEGDHVSLYGLMVEHCEGYQTDWRGQDGLTVMYQSETPYEVPAQEKWMSENGKNGCASYRVEGGVALHRAYGIGIYLVNFGTVNLASAIEAPAGQGIKLHHLVVCDFTQSYGATISHVVNDVGGGVGPNSFRSLIEDFPAN